MGGGLGPAKPSRLNGMKLQPPHSQWQPQHHQKMLGVGGDAGPLRPTPAGGSYAPMEEAQGGGENLRGGEPSQPQPASTRVNGQELKTALQRLAEGKPLSAASSAPATVAALVV